MILSFNTSIWLYPKPIDFRKQMDALVMLVADHLKLNPTSGQLFIFRNRHANKLKILWWDRNWFWLLYRRLEQGRLKFPKVSEETMSLTKEELSWLLSGLDFTKQKLLPEVMATHFY